MKPKVLYHNVRRDRVHVCGVVKNEVMTSLQSPGENCDLQMLASGEPNSVFFFFNVPIPLFHIEMGTEYSSGELHLVENNSASGYAYYSLQAYCRRVSASRKDIPAREQREVILSTGL